MKIRIKGNSLRVRMSQTEVRNLGQGQEVLDQIRFSPTAVMKYSLRPLPEATHLEANFSNGNILVTLPLLQAQTWAQSQDVAMKGNQRVSDSEELSLLVEKDFTCLKTRENESEDESDLFSNPNEAHGHCT